MRRKSVAGPPEESSGGGWAPLGKGAAAAEGDFWVPAVGVSIWTGWGWGRRQRDHVGIWVPGCAALGREEVTARVPGAGEGGSCAERGAEPGTRHGRAPSPAPQPRGSGQGVPAAPFPLSPLLSPFPPASSPRK